MVPDYMCTCVLLNSTVNSFACSDFIHIFIVICLFSAEMKAKRAFNAKYQSKSEARFAGNFFSITLVATCEESVFKGLVDLHVLLGSGDAVFMPPSKKKNDNKDICQIPLQMTQILLPAKKDVPRWNVCARTRILQHLIDHAQVDAA